MKDLSSGVATSHMLERCGQFEKDYIKKTNETDLLNIPSHSTSFWLYDKN